MPYKPLGKAPDSKFNEPQLEQELWRYMDFSNFASVIQTSSLYFSSVSQFDLTDPWEGIPPAKTFSPDHLIEVQGKRKPNRNTNQSSHEDFEWSLKAAREVLGEGFELIMNQQKKSFQSIRDFIYVNCWHMNESESDSQWRIYGGGKHAVAVVSNFSKLCSSITDNREVNGSCIHYYEPKSYTEHPSYLMESAVLKRSAFCHEKEFRLLHNGFRYDLPMEKRGPYPRGISVKVDLRLLIKSVVVSPRAEDWFVTVVKTLLSQHEFSFPVIRSDLLDPVV